MKINALLVGFLLFTNSALAADRLDGNDRQFLETMKQHQSEITSFGQPGGTDKLFEQHVSDSERAMLKQTFVDPPRIKTMSEADRMIIKEMFKNGVEPDKSYMDDAITSSSPDESARWSAPEDSAEQQELKNINTLVFVSFGMPDRVLKQLYAQAADREDVAIVFRGWTPPHFSKFINQVNSVAGDKTVNTMVDPRYFRTYDIDKVPVFLHKTKKYGWRRSIGEFSLIGSEETLERGQNRPVLGNVYEIVEPDLLDEIEKRMGAIDWAKEQESVEQQIRDFSPHYELPTADKNESYLVDLSITFQRDVPGKDDVPLIRAGTRVNPLEHVDFGSRFIVFNPDDKRQVTLAKKWAKQYPDNIVMVTSIPERKSGEPSISEVVGQPVFPLQPYIVDRFQFKNVPCMAYQEGRNMRVEVVKP